MCFNKSTEFKRSRAARGLCPQCGVPSDRFSAAGLAVFCQTCYAVFSAWRLRVRLARKAEGLCVECGYPVEADRLERNVTSCQGCADFKLAKKMARLSL